MLQHHHNPFISCALRPHWATALALTLSLLLGCSGEPDDANETQGEVDVGVQDAGSDQASGEGDMAGTPSEMGPVVEDMGRAEMPVGSDDMSAPDMEPVPGSDPLAGAGAVEKVEFAKNGGKIDNPFWYQSAGKLVFNNGGVQAMGVDGAVTPLYGLEDGSAHSPKTVDRAGNLVGLYFPVAGEKEEHIVLLDGQGGVKETLASEYKGHRLPHANDMAVGFDGTVYFTQRRGKPDDDYLENKDGPGALFRVSPSGEVIEEVNPSQLEDFRNPNGIAVSPDGRTLYVGTSDYDVKSHAGLWRFAIEADGSLGTGEFLGKAGRPDGLCVDERGNIYISNGGGKALHVMSPGGELWGKLDLPQGSHTNCGFGGEQGKTLYISTQKALFSVKMAAAGEVYSRQQ